MASYSRSLAEREHITEHHATGQRRNEAKTPSADNSGKPSSGAASGRHSTTGSAHGTTSKLPSTTPSSSTPSASSSHHDEAKSKSPVDSLTPPRKGPGEVVAPLATNPLTETMTELERKGLTSNFSQAQHLLALNDAAGAVKELNNILRQCPHLNTLQIQKARFELCSGARGIKEARATLDAVNEQRCSPGTLKEKLIVTALVNIASNKLNEARQNLERADQLSTEPSAWSVGAATGWVELSETYLLAGDYPHALEAARRGEKADPGDPRTYVSSGKSLVRTGKLQPALAEYNAASKVNPGYPEAIFYKAALDIVMGKTEDYSRDLQLLQKLSPAKQWDSLELELWNLEPIEALDRADKPEASLKELCLLLNRQFRPVAALLKTRILLRNRRYPEATEWLNNPAWTKAKLAGRERRDYLMFKTEVLAANNKPDEARKLIEQIDSTYDKSVDFIAGEEAPGWLRLGEWYYDAGEFTNAIKYAKKGASARPQASVPYLLMGRASARLGHYQKGIDYMTAGLKLQPTNENLVKERAAIYVAMGKTAEAQAELEKLRRMPDGKNWSMFGIQSLSVKYTTDLSLLGKQMELTGESVSHTELTHVINALSKETDTARRGELLLKKAGLELTASNYEAALRDSDKSIETNRETYRAHAIKAAALLHLKQLDKARVEREQTIRLFALERRSNSSKRQASQSP